MNAREHAAIAELGQANAAFRDLAISHAKTLIALQDVRPYMGHQRGCRWTTWKSGTQTPETCDCGWVQLERRLQLG